MRTALTIAALALLFAGRPAHAQADCYDRYSRVYDQAGQTFDAMSRMGGSAGDREAVQQMQHAVGRIMDWLAFREADLPPTVCGDTLRRVEAQAMVWHERGWTPSAEERAAAERAAALKGLNDALAALEGK